MLRECGARDHYQCARSISSSMSDGEGVCHGVVVVNNMCTGRRYARLQLQLLHSTAHCMLGTSCPQRQAQFGHKQPDVATTNPQGSRDEAAQGAVHCVCATVSSQQPAMSVLAALRALYTGAAANRDMWAHARQGALRSTSYVLTMVRNTMTGEEGTHTHIPAACRYCTGVYI